MNIEVAYETQAVLGEGPVWDDQKNELYWIDIDPGVIHIFDPQGEADRSISVGQMIGCLSLTDGDGLILGLERGFASLDLNTKAVTPLVDPESHLPHNRFNDGKCDPRGRFWAGTLNMKRKEKAAGLYRLSSDLTCKKMLSGVTTSNGLAWSLDHKVLYYIDTPTHAVSAFDFDIDSGSIHNRRDVITISNEQGSPDGMTIDEEGMLWIAHFHGACVTRWNPNNGEILATIPIPAPNVTSCTFGGSLLDELYITTARTDMSEKDLLNYPLAGSLFRAFVGVRGTPIFRFSG